MKGLLLNLQRSDQPPLQKTTAQNIFLFFYSSVTAASHSVTPEIWKVYILYR